MAHDHKSGGELLRTLDAYIACGGSPLDTAHRLHAHRNTVLYRLDRIAELLGVDVRQPEQRLLFHLALRAGEVLGELQPGGISQRPPSGPPRGAARRPGEARGDLLSVCPSTRSAGAWCLRRRPTQASGARQALAEATQPEHAGAGGGGPPCARRPPGDQSHQKYHTSASTRPAARASMVSEPCWTMSAQ